MAQRDNMPEGTDSIIDGASGSSGAGYGGSGGTGYAGDLGTAGGAGYGGGLGTTADAMGAASGADLGGGSDFGSNAGTGGSSTSAFGSSASTGSDGMNSMGGGQSSGGSTGAGGAISNQVANLKSQATDKARSAAMQGKDRATEALGNVSTLVRDAAQMIDERLGGGYGEYARKAAGAIDGLSDQLRNKEVDELLNDARGLIRRSPGAAIGVAATAGFLLVRVLKAAGSGATGSSTSGGMSSGMGTAANDGATPPMVESRGGVA